MTSKLMTAWLIMWEWSGEHAAVDHPYVDVVSSRKGTHYIKDYLQRLHDLHCLSLQERLGAQRYNQPTKPAYKVEVHRTKHGQQVTCGHNPWLVARLVRNLKIETDPTTGEESVSWAPYK